MYPEPSQQIQSTTWAIEMGYDFALLATGYKQKEAIEIYEKY